MASNLTTQVRGIAKVVTAVANGDLQQKLTVEAKGEIAALADTINNMTETAGDLRRPGDHGGARGRRRRPASAARRTCPAPPAPGRTSPRTSTSSPANLTTQVRAIAEVATAVTQGDLTRSIQVDARGEVADLKDNINAMIGNLRDTTERNSEQDWLKTNLAKFSRMMQGQRDLITLGHRLCRS